MEKITKEELMEKLLNNQLSDDELEKVSGAAPNWELNNCLDGCHPPRNYQLCKNKCYDLYG